MNIFHDHDRFRFIFKICLSSTNWHKEISITYDPTIHQSLKTNRILLFFLFLPPIISLSTRKYSRPP